MTIYIVTGYNWEGTWTVGAFSTEQKAIEKVEKCKKAYVVLREEIGGEPAWRSDDGAFSDFFDRKEKLCLANKEDPDVQVNVTMASDDDCKYDYHSLELDQ